VASLRPDAKLRLESGLLFALLLAPLVVGLVWGTYLNDSAYVTFHYARNLAAGRRLTHNLPTEVALSGTEAGQTLLREPLYALALAVPTAVGIPLPQAGLILSALGWGAAAIAMYVAGQTLGWPVAAVVSAVLVAFNPIVVSTLGTGIPWTVAWAWIAIASSIKKQWNAQIGALALMLCTCFDLSALGIAMLLLILQWIRRRHFPLWPSLALAITTLGWELMATWQIVAPLSLPSPSLVESGHAIQQLLDESEFYWLFLPWMGVGLLATTRETLWTVLVLLWGAILSAGAATGAMTTTLGLFLVGLGMAWVVRWIETHDVVRLDRLTLAMSLVIVAGLPLGTAQASSLLQRYQFRPVIRHRLEQQAGDWLRAHSESTATILASERVGYLADRSALLWDGGSSDQRELADLLETLNKNPPEYCVSLNSLAWDHLMQTGWFRDSYTPLQEFESPYDSVSPFAIWGYRWETSDLEERQPLNVHLPGKVDLVGYTYRPDRIQPGDTVYVTLFLQATQPLTQSFRTFARIVSPNDGTRWAQQDMLTPRSVPLDWWQTGQVIAERLVLTATGDIPTGAYHLNISITAPDSDVSLPIYRNDDPSPLDRITLGYVAVPWQGSMDLAQPVGATFGNQIDLLGFEAVDKLSSGTEFLEVTLYWEARQPPTDDYIVFVHLVDANGELVANHDGPPMDRRYPTGAWLPGEVVPDVHRLALDPGIPAGMYRLQVGMYRWPSLERLPVWDTQGAEQTDRVITLQSIEIESSVSIGLHSSPEKTKTSG
jgi:hypothetical protein